MKHLKKKLQKKTVEAYACVHCGSVTDCINLCAGDIVNLDSHAWTFAQASVKKV